MKKQTRNSLGRFDSFKNKVNSFLRKVAILFLIILVGIIIGKVYFPETVIETKEVIVETKATYPVLLRIAKCESSNNHFDKNGQVLMVGNKNGSVDIGKYQINNRVWGKKAKEMNLDLTLEKDNEAFAMYLYTTLGTVPWIWSQKCWNR
jgi:hypothetical protein